MKYWQSEKDKNGLIFSIDNLVILYSLRCSTTYAIEMFRAFFELHFPSSWREKTLNESEFSPFSYAIWCGGVYVKIGQGDRLNGMPNCLRLEVNPNKWFGSPAEKFVREFVYENCFDGVLSRYDLAIDAECQLKEVCVRSRKSDGRAKGTLYYGRRSRHGFLKIYDKKEELKQKQGETIDGDLTRIEFTLSPVKPLPTDEVFLAIGGRVRADQGGLSAECRSFLRLLMQIHALGGDWLSEYNLLGRKVRENLKPYLFGEGFVLELNEGIIKALLKAVSEFYDCDCSPDMAKTRRSVSGVVKASLIDDEEDEEE